MVRILILFNVLCNVLVIQVTPSFIDLVYLRKLRLFQLPLFDALDGNKLVQTLLLGFENFAKLPTSKDFVDPVVK